MNHRSFTTPSRCDVPTNGDTCNPCSPTLANTAGYIEKNLIASHGILDQIEQAINGPTPMSGDKLNPPCGGLMGVLGDCNTSAHAVLRRLENLLAVIESGTK